MDHMRLSTTNLTGGIVVRWSEIDQSWDHPVLLEDLKEDDGGQTRRPLSKKKKRQRGPQCLVEELLFTNAPRSWDT